MSRFRLSIILPAAALALSSCAYIDPYWAVAKATKNDAKVHLAAVNDDWAVDVSELPRTIPAGALARMPAGQTKCAVAVLAGLNLLECGWAGWNPSLAAQSPGAPK